MPTPLKFIAIAFTVLLGSPPLAAAADAIDCDRLGHWTRFERGPQVNLHHIFCGEWDERRGRVKGFHSRPDGQNPSTIGRLEITERADRAGVYGVRWSYRGEPSRTKFSTLFPDSCTADQVLKSIRYAEDNRMRCPNSAPQWAWCGSNRPTSTDAAQNYCEAEDGSRFTIAGGSLSRGDINTAFPLRQ